MLYEDAFLKPEYGTEAIRVGSVVELRSPKIFDLFGDEHIHGRMAFQVGGETTLTELSPWCIHVRFRFSGLVICRTLVDLRKYHCIIMPKYLGTSRTGRKVEQVLLNLLPL